MAVQSSQAAWKTWSFRRWVRHLPGAILIATMGLMQSATAQQAADPGQVLLQVSGADGVFGFSSATLPLNLIVASTDGFAESLPIVLPPGRYEVTADDLSGVGLFVSGLVCSDDDSVTNAAARSVELAISPGEMLTCTFSVTHSTARANRLIGDFMGKQDLVSDNISSVGDRVSRLKGKIGIINSPKPVFNALPGIMAGQPLRLAASLAAFDRFVGNQQPTAFDFWVKGSYALMPEQGRQGRVADTTLGMDYRASSDLLVGAFAQFNATSRTWNDDSAVLVLGWAAGGYATARIADHLYLDVLAGRGNAINALTAAGVEGGTVDAAGWLLNADLLGTWELAGVTFDPRVKVNYASQATASYIDSAGNVVEARQRDAGKIAIGPGISYELTAGDRLAVKTGVRVEASARMLDGLNLGHYRGSVEGSVQLTLPAGGKIGTTFDLGGLGADRRAFTAKGTLSVPLR